MAVFRYQHSSAGSTKFASFPERDLYSCQIGNNRASDGPALDRNSEDELQPRCYVMCSPPPGKIARFSVVLTADICVTESAQVVVYLATDVPWTRAYSVNCTYTPHVRFRLFFLCLEGH
jgi:hypothetical protein